MVDDEIVEYQTGPKVEIDLIMKMKCTEYLTFVSMLWSDYEG